VGEQSLEKFRIEYEKLHRALKTSYESEKRLVKRYISSEQIGAWFMVAGGEWDKSQQGSPVFHPQLRPPLIHLILI
jgi:hypothetical protein